MKNKSFAVRSLLLALSVLIAFAAPVSAEGSTDTVGEVQNLVDGIVACKQGQASSVQAWIDGALTQKAGVSSEWYVFTLSQSGNYDFSAYEEALLTYLSQNTIRSAVTRQKYALTLLAIGSNDPYIAQTANDSIGQQGIMSWVFGLHLLQNGCASAGHTAKSVTEKLLSLQFADGGWALSGNQGDVDVTAMTVQALAPFYGRDSAVTSAVDRAVQLLSERQLDSGDFASYGVPNPESTAQVITALSALGIDCMADERFIKNGSTMLDGLTQYRLADGSFSHKLGESVNDTSTVQTYYALTAYLRFTEGKGGLYELDHSVSQPISDPPAATSAPTTTAAITQATTASSQVTSAVSQTTATSQTTSAVPQTTAASQTTAVSAAATTSAASISTTAAPAVTPTAGTTASTASHATAEQNTPSYRPIAAWAILGAAILVCLILCLTGKRHRKNFIAVAVITALAIVFVYLTDFASADQYYHGNAVTKENAIGTVTLSIRCDTVAGRKDYIPADGVVLDTTQFSIEQGDTVYDILTEAARTCEIQMENSGAEGMVYIAGIQYLYEFEFGDLSGWMYFVNGASPSVGCDQYVLQDGDTIEWLYTCDIGKDIGR